MMAFVKRRQLQEQARQRAAAASKKDD